MAANIELFAQKQIALQTSVSDARFIDEDTLLLIDEEANLWHHLLSTDATTMYASRGEVLQDYVFPERLRSRIFPRIAVGRHRDQVIVNTEDSILVSRDLGGHWRTMIEGRGLYDPPLAFAPDGDAFVMLAESVLIGWDVTGLPSQFYIPAKLGPTEWRDSTHHDARPSLEVHDVEAFTWGADGKQLVVLRADGRLQTIDPLNGEVLGTAGIVTYESEPAQRLAKYCLSLTDGNTLVISLETRALDFWQLDPWELITRVPVEGVIQSITVDPANSWFAMESEHELQFSDTGTLAQFCTVTKPARRWDGVRFSPNRSRMLSIGEPTKLGDTESLLTQAKVGVTIWRVVSS
jgi:hypothetical protein